MFSKRFYRLFCCFIKKAVEFCKLRKFFKHFHKSCMFFESNSKLSLLYVIPDHDYMKPGGKKIFQESSFNNKLYYNSLVTPNIILGPPPI